MKKLLVGVLKLCFIAALCWFSGITGAYLATRTGYVLRCQAVGPGQVLCLASPAVITVKEPGVKKSEHPRTVGPDREQIRPLDRLQSN